MNDKIVISAKHVSKYFKLPHEKHSGLKQAVLNFRRGEKTFELQHVLDNVSFEIKQGEFFGIVGRNGSGKSTLLKILAGIYQPTDGKVQVEGKLVPFIELGVGFNPELTGRENVFLNGALLGFSHKETEAMYDGIVEFAEIEAFMDQKLKNYSSGMQVRLAFSIAIRAKSDILLIDEVLAVGDANFQQKCFDYFEELKRKKQTVVFVSHDMGAVRRFCTRAIYISKGELVMDGSPSDIADLYTEKNISSHEAEGEEKSSGSAPEASKLYKIEAKLLGQPGSFMNLEVTYSSEDDSDIYVGISVLKDGSSIAEITTPLEMKLAGNGKVNYSLDTSIFNTGAYQIGVALFRRDNRELIAVSPTRCNFVIKGSDITRGAAFKLPSTWSAE